MAEFFAPWGPAGAAAIEGPSLGSVHREYDMGEGSGAIRSWVYESAGIEMAVIPPSNLKLYAAGSGSADKAAMVQYAVRELGLPLDPNDDDAADAAALAHLAYALRWHLKPTTRHAAQVVHDLRQPQRPKVRAKRVPAIKNI